MVHRVADMTEGTHTHRDTENPGERTQPAPHRNSGLLRRDLKPLLSCLHASISGCKEFTPTAEAGLQAWGREASWACTCGYSTRGAEGTW